MKTLLIVLGLFGVSFAATAQEAQTTVNKETYPIWTISKDVQKIQYRQSTYAPSSLRSGDTGLALSKDVQRVNRMAPETDGKIRTSGTPDWVVSKGVARMNNKK